VKERLDTVKKDNILYNIEQTERDLTEQNARLNTQEESRGNSVATSSWNR